MDIRVISDLLEEKFSKLRLNNRHISESFNRISGSSKTIKEENLKAFNRYLLYLVEYRYLKTISDKYHLITQNVDEGGKKPPNMISFNKLLSQMILDMVELDRMMSTNIKYEEEWLTLEDVYQKISGEFNSHIMEFFNSEIRRQVLSIINRSRKNPIVFSIGLSYMNKFNESLSNLEDKLRNFPDINIMDIYPNNYKEDVPYTYRFIINYLLENTPIIYKEFIIEQDTEGYSYNETKDSVVFKIYKTPQMENGIFFKNELLIKFLSLTDNADSIYKIRNNLYKYTNLYKNIIDNSIEYVKDNYNLIGTESNIIQLINQLTIYELDENSYRLLYLDIFEKFLIYIEGSNFNDNPEVFSKYISERFDKLNYGFNCPEGFYSEYIKIDILYRFVKNFSPSNINILKDRIERLKVKYDEATNDIILSEIIKGLSSETFKDMDASKLRWLNVDEFNLLKRLI